VERAGGLLNTDLSEHSERRFAVGDGVSDGGGQVFGGAGRATDFAGAGGEEYRDGTGQNGGQSERIVRRNGDRGMAEQGD